MVQKTKKGKKLKGREEAQESTLSPIKKKGG